MKKEKPNASASPSKKGRPKDVGKHEDIIRAASSLFFNEGYELTSMETVARKANVSKLTIYSHFADKEALFKEVVWQRCDKRALTFMTMVDKSVEVALTSIGNDLATLVFSPESIRLQRIMQAEAVHHRKVVEIFYEAGPKRVRAAFRELLKIWHQQKKLIVHDVSEATEQFFSLLKGERLMKTLLLLSPPPTRTEIKKHVDAAVTLFLAGYEYKNRGRNR